MNRTFQIEPNSTFYRGSGQVVAAVVNGQVIDVIYLASPADELSARKTLFAAHPDARCAGGMLSCYELSVFDPSEFDLTA